MSTNYLLQRNVQISNPVTPFPDNSVALTNAPTLDFTTFGQNWTQLATPYAQWTAIATSATGQYITAVAGNIYTSSNYGGTWTLVSGTVFTWSSVAVSSSGQYQVACINSGTIYYSSDYGVTWTSASSNGATTTKWLSIAMSSTGQYATAVGVGGIYLSSNYGQNWAQLTSYKAIDVYGTYPTGTTSAGTTTNNVWSGIAMSSSGQYQTAYISSTVTTVGGLLYYSNNYGVTWTAATWTPGTSALWATIGISSSGQYQCASITDGTIYYSSSYGQSWTASNITSNVSSTLALSSSGQYAIASNGIPLAYYYKFDSGDIVSTTVKNYATGVYDATIVGSPTISTSVKQIGTGSLSLVSASSQYVTLPPFTMSSSYTGVTFSTWINANASITNGYIFEITNVAKGASNTIIGNTGTSCFMYYNSGNVYFTITSLTNTGGQTIIGQTSVALSTGTWTHITWVMTSTSWNIYINGVLTSQTSLTTITQYLLPSIYGGGIYPYFYIGQTTTPSSNRYFWGNIDDFRVYTAPLTAAQILSIYNNNNLVTTPTQLSLNYGKTWSTITNTSYNFSKVAVSSSGQYVYGCTNRGGIYQGILTNSNSNYQNVNISGNTTTGLITYLDGSVNTSSALSLDYSTFGKNWSQVTLSFNSYGICMSASGQYQTACANNGYIYISSNYGQSWTQVGTSQGYTSVCMSASGQYQSACAGYISISSDYGQSWIQVGASRAYSSICISSSGQYQSACVTNGYIYISSNYGQSWTQVGTSQGYTSVCMSASGQYQSACVSTGYIYISSNYGQSWTQVGTSQAYSSVCMSASGQYQVSCVYNGYIYISSDYGQSWTQQGTSQIYWYIAMPASGQYLKITTNSTTLYTSITYNPSSYTNGTISATGAISAGGNISTTAAISSSGAISAGGNISTTGAISSTGTISAGGNITTTGSITANSSIITNSNIIASAITSNGFVMIGANVNSSLLTVGLSSLPSSNSIGTTHLTVYGNINCYRNRLIFSDTLNDWYHCIYNNNQNNDGEGVWNGMKFNVYDGAWFRVGNSPSTSSALYINSSGQVGIGTTTLSYNLDVAGTTRITGNTVIGPNTGLYYQTPSRLTIGTNYNNGSAGGLCLDASDVVAGNYRMYLYPYIQAESHVGYQFSILNTSTTTLSLSIGYNGNVGIGVSNPSYALHVSGAIYASGDITALSDQRHKQDITPLSESLTALTKLSGYSYTRTDYKPGEKQIGLIAQEVKEVYPEAVSYDETHDIYSLNYGCLIAPVIQALKELKEKVAQQDATIKLLLNRA